MLVSGTCSVRLPPVDPKARSEKPTPANITGESHVIRVNEGRMTGDIFDGAWAPRVYDFGGDLTDLQKMHGELAYQILAQRDKALSFSRNNLVQEGTRVPPQAFEAYTKGLLTDEHDPTRAIYFKNAMRLYGKEKGGAVYPEAAFQLGRSYLNQNQWKETAEYFTMLQQREPHYGEAQFYAGLSYWKVGDLPHALET